MSQGVPEGSWVLTPIRLDTTALTAVSFQVYSTPAPQKPFEFCISNVRVLR